MWVSLKLDATNVPTPTRERGTAGPKGLNVNRTRVSLFVDKFKNRLLIKIIVKLTHTQPRTRTYIQTGQRALRATQVRAALSHVYATTYQNRITDIL
jgi:hypothetical protein